RKTPPKTVAEAEAHLAAAIEAEAGIERDRRALRDEEDKARTLIDRLHQRLRLEIAAVIRASPEMQALREEHDRCDSRIDAICELARQLPPGAVGLKYIRPPGADTDRTLANPWVAAI